MKISYSIAAHAVALSLVVAFASAPRVAAPVPHHIETMIYVPVVAPVAVVVPVRVRSTQTAQVAVATVAQGAPAHIKLGQSVISPKLAISATTEMPSFGELPDQRSLSLPSTGHASVKAAPVAKLANFEQQAATAVVRRTALVKPVVHPVVQPTVTYMEHPEYTKDALRAHIEGQVSVRVVLRADGTVLIAGVSSGLGYGLDESAVRTAETIRFSPATHDGSPVDFPTTVHIHFQLSAQEGL